MRVKVIWFVLLCSCVTVFFGMRYFEDLAGSAKIELIAVSENDIDEDATLTISAGIPNVGIGEKVYLKENTGAVSYSWTLADKPDASTSTLTGATTQTPTLTPDVAGQYLVRFIIDGTSDPDTLWISAGRYVGVGTIAGASPDVSKGQCAVCHGAFSSHDKVTPWSGTGHAAAYEGKLDGDNGPFFGANEVHCSKCHTVGYKEDASNGGFDDVSDLVGCVFPSSAQSGNFNNIVTNFPDLAALANIQCENCHGPGSLHRGLTAKNEIAKSFETGVCDQCHDADPYHVISQQWEESVHAVATQYPSGPSRGSCVQCHTGSGFISTWDPDYAAKALNTDFNPINCQTCHDPHSAENQHQLRKLTDIELNNGEEIIGGGLGMICSNCHLSRRDSEAYIVEQLAGSSMSSHFGPHGSPQTDMLFGKNAVEFGKPVGVSPHAEVVENTCVGCHMQSYDPHEPLSIVKAEMGNPSMTDLKTTELTRNVYGHSFWNKYEDDDDVVWENVSACRDCHGEEMTSFDDVLANEDFDGDGSIEGVQSEVEGMLLKLAELLPPVGPKTLSAFHPDPDNHDYTEVEAKALYNFLFVYEDGSMGVHNAAYAIGLIRSSITALGVGDIGAGSVSSVTECPERSG